MEFILLQILVQKYIKVVSFTSYYRAILVNIPLQFIFDLLACTVGLVLYSYFSECDPLNHPDPDKHLSSPNQVLVSMIISSNK